jgi:tryptophan halogenase
MPDTEIKRVVVAGGGTAGWIAASLLNRVLGTAVEIHLVESEEVGAVGVGEATIPPLMNLFVFLGLPENEVVQAVQGTFKLGIEFEGWLRPGHRYFHAFGTPGRDLGIVSFYQYWLKEHLVGRGGALWDYSLTAQAASANRFAPLKRIPDTDIEGITHALHFDAGLLARYLRGKCEAQGVVRREGHITAVNLRAEDGYIESLTLKSGEVVAADFFIDCTGFRALLIEGALKSGFDDWSYWLPCDRAWAAPCAFGPEGLTPFTRTTARSAGWQWRIPLQHRVGNGHVFSSRFMAEDEARRILLDNLEGEPLAEPRLLKFTAGRRRTSWVKNCLALGLASGFLEPLESTSIHLVQSAMTRFVKMFPGRVVTSLEQAEFNRQTRHEYELIRDFLVLHYWATERDDSDFWRYCRGMDVPETLKTKVAYFREHGRLIVEEADLFRESNWAQVLIGQGVLPTAPSALTRLVEDKALGDYMANIRQIVAATVRELPPHGVYIDRWCKASSPAA